MTRWISLWPAQARKCLFSGAGREGERSDLQRPHFRIARCGLVSRARFAFLLFALGVRTEPNANLLAAQFVAAWPCLGAFQSGAFSRSGLGGCWRSTHRSAAVRFIFPVFDMTTPQLLEMELEPTISSLGGRRLIR